MAPNQDSDTLCYHLGELKLSSDISNPRRLLPPIAEQQRVILDIGCGIGQAFVASGIHESDNHLLIGLDNELEPLIYGKAHFGNISFLNGSAEQMPLASSSIDFVVSRVTLPYTNIPRALDEIYRVLKPGAQIWVTLHTCRVLLNPLLKYFRTAGLKGIVMRSYFVMSSILFHLFGFLLPHPRNGTYESFQTNYRMRQEFKRCGFEDITIIRGTHFLVTAKKPDVNPD